MEALTRAEKLAKAASMFRSKHDLYEYMTIRSMYISSPLSVICNPSQNIVHFALPVEKFANISFLQALIEGGKKYKTQEEAPTRTMMTC